MSSSAKARQTSTIFEYPLCNMLLTRRKGRDTARDRARFYFRESRACFKNTSEAESRSRRDRRRRGKCRVDVHDEPAADEIVPAKHWSAPRSSGACTAAACARLRSADGGCSRDRGRSGRFHGGAVVGAADRNRNRDRQSPAPVFVAGGLSLAGHGLRPAWLPQA